MTIHPAIPPAALLLASCLWGTADAQQRMPAPPATITQFSFHERIVIRIPRIPIGRRKASPSSPIVWKEKHGPKCIAATDLGGAMISGPSAVDLALAGSQRIRAKLDGDCQPLDFYGGFYIKPGADGQVCADRDAIRVRSGASCRIDTFKRLVPKR